MRRPIVALVLLTGTLLVTTPAQAQSIGGDPAGPFVGGDSLSTAAAPLTRYEAEMLYAHADELSDRAISCINFIVQHPRMRHNMCLVWLHVEVQLIELREYQRATGVLPAP